MRFLFVDLDLYVYFFFKFHGRIPDHRILKWSEELGAWRSSVQIFAGRCRIVLADKLMLLDGNGLESDLIRHFCGNVTLLFNFGRRLILEMECLIHGLELKFTIVLVLFLLYFHGFFRRSASDWINDVKI